MSPGKNAIAKIGAYIVLIFGIICSVILIGAGITLFFVLPQYNISKKAIIAGVLILIGVLSFLVAFAIFESLLELTIVGEKLDDIEGERKGP